MKKDLDWISNSTREFEVCGGEDGTSDDKNQVTFKDNRIYFYSEVTRSRNLTLNKSIVELANYYQAIGITLGSSPVELYLHINSYGGSVFAGLSSVDYIINSKVPVTTVIDGCAASAATLMSIVGKRRLMHKHSYMLIHQLSSGMWGKYEELKDDMENCDSFMKTIKDIYEEHTNIPKKELAKVLKHDLWWDAETCLKYGLIDEII
jgi:ATP-dependent Clp endopeptidase proteolytic subunit ClpP